MLVGERDDVRCAYVHLGLFPAGEFAPDLPPTSPETRENPALRVGSSHAVLGFLKRRGGGFEPPVPFARHNGGSRIRSYLRAKTSCLRARIPLAWLLSGSIGTGAGPLARTRGRRTSRSSTCLLGAVLATPTWGRRSWIGCFRSQQRPSPGPGLCQDGDGDSGCS